MKDYVTLAGNMGISIYQSIFDEPVIKNYKINRRNNNVEITYMTGCTEYKELIDMTGCTEYKELIDTTREELDNKQRYQLEELKSKIYPKVDQKLRFNGPIGGAYAFNGILNSLFQRWGLGLIWFSASFFYSISFLRPLKLKKDMEISGWIHDNREDVNKIIKEAVERKMDKPQITAETINMPMREYPTEKVPYSESMYEDGISLNNVDELSTYQLYRLKRKVLAKRKENKNERFCKRG